MSIADWTQITADSKLNEILATYPSVGPILVQAGRGWVDKRGDLYAQFPDLTVGQYAENNGLEATAVVKSIQAAAEAEEMAKKGGMDDKDESIWRRPPLTIGYTSSYDEREGTSEGSVSVVHVQSSRGPI
jgi:hypothetical protein